MKRQTGLLKSALTILLLGLSAGCGTAGPGGTTVSGGNPAAPPGPPAEIPSALRFPSDLAIDVDTIASSSPEADASALAALVGSGGQFSREISFAADLAPLILLQVDGLMQPLPQLDIPASTETTTFAIKGLFGNPSKPTDPPIEYDIKIDFADFGGQGCSGHTAGLPICYRIWFDGEQRMAGVFTKFPTALSSGAGQFRLIFHKPEEGGGAEPATDVYFGVIYDHSDPLAKTTETFERAVLAGEPVNPPDPVPSFHVEVSQEGPDETAKKLFRLSLDGISTDFASEVTGTPADLRYTGRWREDNDFWSGSIATQNIELQNFSDVCASISTGNSSNPLNCLDLGIDVADIPFLDFLTSDDIGLPDDFPVGPTF